MKKTILKLTARLSLPVFLLAITSCSSTPQSETAAGRGAIVLNAVTASATVKAIDASSRTVVLQHPDGSLTAYECGPEVLNFDQIKVGDQVTATTTEELAIALMKGGHVPMGSGTASAIVRSPLGDKPGGKIVDTVGFIARVVSVDVQNRQVTLQMAEGGNKTVVVGPDINLDRVKPGDNVGVRLTRALAISVTTPQ